MGYRLFVQVANVKWDMENQILLRDSVRVSGLGPHTLTKNFGECLTQAEE